MILVLHALGIGSNTFSSVQDTELIFPRYAKNVDFLVINCRLPIISFIEKCKFNAVFIMSSFFDYLGGTQDDTTWQIKFDFLKKLGCPIVAFPQDDYWLSEMRNRFYVYFKVNRVYSVCPEQSWNELFQDYLKQPYAQVVQGYTFYITPKLLSIRKYSKSLNDRNLDVVYRAKGIPTAPNYFGYIKSIIGKRFSLAVKDDNLKLDISTNNEDLITGDDWYRFISNSLAILGSNSGSSVNLRNKYILNQIVKLRALGEFDDILKLELLTIDDSDRNKKYTAISPRNFEAAMLDVVQILVEGEYSGILCPWEDYIPLKEDCSNINEVIEILRDKSYCKTLVESCRGKFLNFKPLNVDYFITSIFSFLSNFENHSEFPLRNKIILYYVYCYNIILHFFYSKLYFLKFQVILLKKVFRI